MEYLDIIKWLTEELGSYWEDHLSVRSLLRIAAYIGIEIFKREYLLEEIHDAIR